MQTEELTTTEHPIYVGVPMMDETEARACVTRIKTRIDIARGELLELKDREGWRALGYKNWSACARLEFGMSVATLYRQLEAAEIMRSLDDSQFENLPTSHLQAVRHLAPEQRVDALTQARVATKDKPTAKAVQQAAAEIAAPDLPPEFAIVQRRFAAHGWKLIRHGVWYKLSQPDGTLYNTYPTLEEHAAMLEVLDRAAARSGVPAPADPATELTAEEHQIVAAAGYEWQSSNVSPGKSGKSITYHLKSLGSNMGVSMTRPQFDAWLKIHAPIARDPADQERLGAQIESDRIPESRMRIGYEAKEEIDLILIAKAKQAIASGDADCARDLLDQVQVATYRRDQVLATMRPAGRSITLEFTPDDCAALLKEARMFSSSEHTKGMPTIGQTLILLVQAIRAMPQPTERSA